MFSNVSSPSLESSIHSSLHKPHSAAVAPAVLHLLAILLHTLSTLLVLDVVVLAGVRQQQIRPAETVHLRLVHLLLAQALAQHHFSERHERPALAGVVLLDVLLAVFAGVFDDLLDAHGAGGGLAVGW